MKKLFVFALITVLLLALAGCGGKNTKTAGETQAAAANQGTPTEATAPEVTEEEAKAIALEHAELTADQVTGLVAHREQDDGQVEWEVEFRVDRTEYEYTIHAETGLILDFDVDYDD